MHMQNEPRTSFNLEIVRASATLLAALLALMAFMLVVGVQNPQNDIKNLLSASLVLLGFNLVLAVAVNLALERSMRSIHAALQTAKPKKINTELQPSSQRGVNGLRVFQQAMFAASIIAVVWLALGVVQFFYTPLPTAPPGTSPQSIEEPQPSPESPTAPAPAP